MIERDPLTDKIIGAAIEVHREMGPGLLESVYQSCMEIELEERGIKIQPQVRLPLKYKSRSLTDEYLVLDLYVPGKLVVELKAVERVLPVHDAQLLTYLKLTGAKTGLLLNFNVPVLRDGIKRMVFG